MWQDEASGTTVVLLDASASKSGLMATFSWKLQNVLLQTAFPEPATSEDAEAAISAQEYTRDMVVELEQGQRRLVLLTPVQPDQRYEMDYSWQARAMPCLECGKIV